MRLAARLLAVLVVALVLAGGSAGCGKSGSEDISGKQTNVPDEVVTDFVTQETDSGRVRWTLQAPHASRYNDRKIFVMDDPKIEFYDRFGNLQTTLTSKKGEYSDKTHDMLAYGNVVVVSVDGDVLDTDSLRYLNKEDKIVSDSFVKLTRGQDVVTGYGLECDHDLSSVDIKRNVKARLIDQDKTLEGKIDG